MSRPRQVLPGQFQLITRRCTQRQFLLRPDEQTTNAFAYCLAVAAARFDIDVVLSMVESNHHHTIVFDRHGVFPAFMAYLHRLVACCQNARLGRWENLWASEEACVTNLVDLPTVIAKLVYAASNPVKDLLVERAVQWPGLNGYRQLLSGKAIRATRPRFYFRELGPMPKAATLRFVIPAELGAAKDVIAAVQSGVEKVEASTKAHRAATGKPILGRRRILAQSWRASPTSREPRRGLRPRFAGTTDNRVAALLEYRAFQDAYAVARARWLAGDPPEFPVGTYWLARCAPIHPLPTAPA